MPSEERRTASRLASAYLNKVEATAQASPSRKPDERAQERDVTLRFDMPPAQVSVLRENLVHIDPQDAERQVSFSLPGAQMTTVISRFHVFPFLKVEGVIIPVKLAAPTHAEELIGTQRRSFSGRMRSGIRRRARHYRIVTPLLPIDEARDLRELLIRPPPLVCESALFTDGQPVRCHIGPISGGYHRGSKDIGAMTISPETLTQLMSLEFDLIEE